MDIVSEKKRSWIMSRIKGQDTKPERIVRNLLHRMGYRFRLHSSKLPGKPDIILPKYKTVIFVHGCFWHRHKRCKLAYMPKSRVSFWDEKFRQNVERDKKKKRELKKLGWHIIVVWECQTKHHDTLATRLQNLLSEENDA